MATTAQTQNRIRTIDWSFASRIEFWFEVMWLSALALIPVLFAYRQSLVTFGEAKSYALHFFALLTLVLLITDAANHIVKARARGEKFESFDVLEWLRANKANLLLAAVGAFCFVYVMSTALSQMPFFSLWGVTPASDGYNLYSFLSMMVIFFAIVTYIRDASQIWRILYLVAIIGTLTSIYGIAQRFDIDPIGVADTSNRVVSSFGNPIYFGAFLAMSIPITMALVLDFRLTGKKRILAVGLIAVAIALQFTALWYTGSRGPLVGMAAGATAVLAGAALVLNRRQFMAISGASGLSLLLAVIWVVFVSGGGSVSQPTRGLEFGSEIRGVTSADGSGVVQGGLAGRVGIWKDVLELSTSWQTFQEDKGIAKVLRPVFGFGPDMYRFSSPLVSSPRATLEIADHTHNRGLQVLVEQGWIGFIVFLTIIGLIGWLIVLIALKLYKQRHSSDKTIALIFVAITAAIAGTAVEQLVGVGRVSDLLLSWVLIGLIVVIYRHVSLAKPIQIADSEANDEIPYSRQSKQALQAPNQSLAALPFAIGVLALVVALTTFMLVDGQILRASRMTFGQERAGDKTEVYNRFIRARDIAPQIEFFTTFPVDLLMSDARELLAQGKVEDASALAQESFRLLLEYHKRNPLAVRTRLFIAENAALLVEIGLPDFEDEMILRYDELARQFPNEAGVLAVVANAYAAAERFDESLAMTDHIISLEPVVGPVPQAWWVRGKVFNRLDQQDKAIEAFEGAIKSSPRDEFALLSHIDLANIYDELGDKEKAEEHRMEAEKLKEAGVERL